jgi:hypothetical protein
MTVTFNAPWAAGPPLSRRAMRLVLVSLALLACDRGEPSAQSPSSPSAHRRSEGARASAPMVDGAPQETVMIEPRSADAPKTAVDEGKIPLDYPVVASAARPGSYVLAPPREWIEQAFERGAEAQSFVYYGGWLRETGARSSRVEYLTGRKAVVPNSMIIAIRPRTTAQPGDIVLTSWASGAALQRAIVIDGGAPERPRVRYLDLELESASGWGKRADTLRENTFHTLDKPGEVGTTVACQDGPRRTHWIITHRSQRKMLVLGFAGRLRVFDEDACRPLPLVPKLAAGDQAMVPVLGAFVAARVSRVEPQIGRVFVRVRSAGKDEERAPSFTNVAPPFEN